MNAAKTPRAAGRPAIVVGTDFSAAAGVAVAWARAVAVQCGGTLHVVHAVPLPPEISDPYGVLMARTADHLVETARSEVEKIAVAARADGLQAVCHVELSWPARTLLSVAQSVGAELVVVGTRGLTGMRTVLLGSTARRVLPHAPCPVLAVHPEERPPALPVSHVLLPTDLALDPESVLGPVDRLFGPLAQGGKVTLLHVLDLPAEYYREPVFSMIPIDLDPKAVAAGIERRLTEVADRMAAAGRVVEPALCEGPTAARIVEEARARRADLVAIASHGRSGLPHLLLGSVAERVVQLADAPVLVVHPPRG
jgi:nucleotide-binding universal stress UspA family protein